MSATETMASWRGAEVLDRDGDKIGKLAEIYLDEETGRAEWALVNTGMLGTRSNFVPLTGAQTEDDKVRLAFDKSQVKEAPSIDEGQDLSQEEEAQLYSHYGIAYGEQRSDSGLPEGGGQQPAGQDTSGPTTDSAMTRSEEELHVGKAARPAGRVRLREYVVTDQVQQTVPVRREEVRLEREPITESNVDQAMDCPAISDEVHEVTLMEE